MNAVEIKNVTYTYPLEKKSALTNLSAVFEEGKLYGIIGPNGSGKTTLCNLVRGMVPNFYQGKLTGEICIFGKKMSEIDFSELAVEVGFIFQNPFTQISGVRETVFEEIAMGLENLGIPRSEMIERTMAIIKTLGIESIMKNNPNALSGGQKQRVAFASVIVMDPPIMVIDEPTSQLDPFGTERIFEIIHHLKERGKTILLVEHKVELLAEYADEILVLNNGELVAKGPAQQVLGDINTIKKGVALPPVAVLGHELREDGIQLSRIPITLSQAVEELKNREKEGTRSE